MCLNETYCRVRVGKHLSSMFPIKNGFKQGAVLLLLFCTFALKYPIRRVQKNQDGLRLSGRLFPIFWFILMILYIGWKRAYNKEEHRNMVAASKEIKLEVNADKIKYMVMPRDQNAGRSHNIKIYKSSFGRTEELKYVHGKDLNESKLFPGRIFPLFIPAVLTKYI